MLVTGLFLGSMIWFTTGVLAAFLENLAYSRIITILESGEYEWTDPTISQDDLLKVQKLAYQHRTKILVVGLSALQMPLTVLYAFVGWWFVASLKRKQ